MKKFKINCVSFENDELYSTSINANDKMEALKKLYRDGELYPNIADKINSCPKLEIVETDDPFFKQEMDLGKIVFKHAGARIKMTAKQVEVYWLKRKGLSEEEIAEKLKTNVNNVKTHLEAGKHKARVKSRKDVIPKIEEEIKKIYKEQQQQKNEPPMDKGNEG